MVTTTPPAQGAAPQAHAFRDLALRGSLDATTTLGLRVGVTESVQDGPAVVLLDVSGVTSVTASGVAATLELLRLARSRGGDLRLHGTSEAVAHAQLAARLTQITRVYASREEAVAAAPSRQDVAPSLFETGRRQARERLDRAHRSAHRHAHSTAHAIRATLPEVLRPILVDLDGVEREGKNR